MSFCSDCTFCLHYYLECITVGYFNYTLSNTYNDASFFEVFLYGFLAVMPKLVVSYAVGLGIEFAWAQWKNEEIQEGFLVTGILVPLIVPVNCPLWTLAIATAFSVIIVKRYWRNWNEYI